MSLAVLLQALPDAHRKHLDPTSPKPMRAMAAKGMAPLPPREMVMVLVGMTLDEDDGLADSARSTLAGLPDKIVGPAIDSNIPPEALVGLASVFAAAGDAVSEEILEKFVLNRDTPDTAIALLAATVPATIAEIIAGNQERAMRSEDLVDAIRQNANVLKSSLDRLFDFLVRSGIFFENMPEFETAMARLSPAELQETAEKIELPSEIDQFLDDHAGSDELSKQVIEALETDDPDADGEVHKRIPVLKLIAGLNVAQKIALAAKGNKEARTILIRERNRLVAAAAINNPRITEPEVVASASSRSVSDEVIRAIARDKEKTRAYGVKKALVYNPKTPIPTTMHFLTLLRVADLKDVGKSKNVPSAVRNQAKRLLSRRK